MNQLLSIRVNINLVLDVVYILISANPCWSSSEMGEIFCINIIFFVSWSHQVEGLRWNG